MTGPSRPLVRRWRDLVHRLTGQWHSARSPERVRTATDLESMTPDERDAFVRSGFITDPTKVPPESVARARRRADAHLAAAEGRDDPT